MKPITNVEMDYRVLSTIEEKPELSQRELALRLGVSLGKTNYCLRALVGAGMVKVGNFGRSDSKSSYSYLLTARGMKQKAMAAREFLYRKTLEYDRLSKEINELREQLQISEGE